MIPTTKELKETYLANIEGKLNQTSPLSDKAFNRVLAAIQAMIHTSLYKYAVERLAQNLALTATGEDLERQGEEIGVIRDPANAAVLELEIEGEDETIIENTDFIGESNNIRYTINNAGVITDGTGTVVVTAATVGANGNLNIGDSLTVTNQISGLASFALVSGVRDIGADEEEEAIYRQRVLAAKRIQTGGGNAGDYKIWSEEVIGVEKAYCFAGKPYDNPEESFPGDRTIYIQANTAINPDGIAPEGLLTLVRNNINAQLPPLGHTDSTLYIESIVRTGLYVKIIGLNITSDFEVQAKVALQRSISTYIQNLRPYVFGVDLLSEKNNVITLVSLANVVQDTLQPFGGTAFSVAFGETIGVQASQKTLNLNELVKLIGIAYE